MEKIPEESVPEDEVGKMKLERQRIVSALERRKKGVVREDDIPQEQLEVALKEIDAELLEHQEVKTKLLEGN